MKVEDVYSGSTKHKFRSIVINTSEGELGLRESSFKELNGERMVEILKKEKSPITTWKDIAITYYRLGNVEDYEYIINKMREPQYDYLTYEGMNYKDIKIDLLNSLACHALYVKNDKNFANELVREANSIDTHNPMTSIMQALIELQSEDTHWDRVKNLVSTAMQMTDKSVPVRMARACVLYHEGKYKESLDIYKSILVPNCNAPAEVRLGIGLCHYQMGNLVIAKKAFERTRALDKTNTGCLVGLALLELNQPREKRNMKLAMGYLSKAFKIDPNNAMALNYLSTHYYVRGEYGKVDKLTKKALKSTNVPNIKSESFFQLFKVALANEDMQEARKMLKCIEEVGPKDYAVADYALGHMYLQANDIPNAIQAFERGLGAQRKSYHANKILGTMFVEQNKPRKALKHLKEAYRQCQHTDVELLLELANLEPNPKEALRYMEQAHKVIKSNPKTAPISLDSYVFWSNYASLHERNRELDVSLKYYEKALHLAQATVQSYSDEHVYLLFNIARVYETHTKEWVDNELPSLNARHAKLIQENEERSKLIEDIKKKHEKNETVKKDVQLYKTESKKRTLVKKDIEKLAERIESMEHFQQNPVDYFEEAKAIYLSLMKSHPFFLESYLRMAQISDRENNLDQAVRWCHLAAAVIPESPLSYGVLGSIYFRRNQWRLAQDEFQKILAINPKHSYANLALGCIYFYQVVNRKTTNREDKDRFFRYMNHAAKLFRTSISLDPSNSNAAVSLAAVIAERGYVAQAREMLNQIREYTQSISELWLNLGNIELSQGHPMNAVKTYQHCIDTLPDSGRKKRLGELYHLIAHAYYKDGKLDDTSSYLDKASQFHSQSHTVTYNRSVANYSSATKLILNSTTPIESRRSAMKVIEDAEKEFNDLSSVDSQQISFKAKQFAERIHEKIGKFRTQLETWEERERELIEKRKASLAAMQSQIEEQRLAREAEQARLREAEEKALQIERENEEQLEYLRITDPAFKLKRKISNPDDNDVTVASKVNHAEAQLEAEYNERLTNSNTMQDDENVQSNVEVNQPSNDDTADQESDDEFGDLADAFGDEDEDDNKDQDNQDEESDDDEIVFDDSSKRSRNEKSGSDDASDDDESLEPPSKRKRTL